MEPDDQSDQNPADERPTKMRSSSGWCLAPVRQKRERPRRSSAVEDQGRGDPVVTQPGGEGGGFPMAMGHGSAASLAMGESCTEKNDVRNDRELLIPMRSQAASAGCVRDPESRSAPGLKTKPRSSLFLFTNFSLGEFNEFRPRQLRRYDTRIQSSK
jgi:hypothetical protein